MQPARDIVTHGMSKQKRITINKSKIVRSTKFRHRKQINAKRKKQQKF